MLPCVYALICACLHVIACMYRCVCNMCVRTYVCEYLYAVVCMCVCMTDQTVCGVKVKMCCQFSHLTDYTHYTLILNMIGTFIVTACHRAQCVVCASIKPACKQCIMALGCTDG